MKKMITAKYVGIQQFANEISISYTTLQSIFKRGLKAGIQNINELPRGKPRGIKCAQLVK